MVLLVVDTQKGKTCGRVLDDRAGDRICRS